MRNPKPKTNAQVGRMFGLAAPLAAEAKMETEEYLRLVVAVYLINPAGCGLIVQHINAHFHRLIAVHAKPLACRDTQAAAGASLLKEATEAINRLHIEGCTPHTLRELVELRDTADSIIQSVEQTMSQEDQNP